MLSVCILHTLFYECLFNQLRKFRKHFIKFTVNFRRRILTYFFSLVVIAGNICFRHRNLSSLDHRYPCQWSYFAFSNSSYILAFLVMCRKCPRRAVLSHYPIYLEYSIFFALHHRMDYTHVRMARTAVSQLHCGFRCCSPYFSFSSRGQGLVASCISFTQRQ